MPTVVNLPTPAPESPGRGSRRPVPHKCGCRNCTAGYWAAHCLRPKRPEVDWTGHIYKATSELRIDYTRNGRERMRGKPDYRNVPPIPGGKTRTTY